MEVSLSASHLCWPAAAPCHQDSTATSVTPALCTCQRSAFHFSSQALRPRGTFPTSYPCNKATAGSCCFLYFLHFQQFAKLKHTHLLNQGHHLEHDQDYEICILSLSEQSASRWDNTLISCSVSATILSHFSIFFFFVLIWNALKQNQDLSKANKERISSSDWGWLSKIVTKHSVLGPVWCWQWTRIKMRGVIVKLWAKGLDPFLYSPLSTSLFQQQANSKTRLFTRVWRSILTVFCFFCS